MAVFGLGIGPGGASDVLHLKLSIMLVMTHPMKHTHTHTHTHTLAASSWPPVANPQFWQIKSQKKLYLKNYWADFNHLLTQCEEHPGADSVSWPALNSVWFLRYKTNCVRIGTRSWPKSAIRSTTLNHKKIHISKTTGPISTKFSHKVEDTKGQIILTDEVWIPSVGWENPLFVSELELKIGHFGRSEVTQQISRITHKSLVYQTQTSHTSQREPNGWNYVNISTKKTHKKSDFESRNVHHSRSNLEFCTTFLKILNFNQSQNCWYHKNQHEKPFNLIYISPQNSKDKSWKFKKFHL